MRRRQLLLAWALAGPAAAGEKMDPMQADKVARFKQRIDFDAVLQPESRAEAAVVTWPAMTSAPGLGQPAWMLAADTLWREGGGAVREWVLRRGRETLSMLAFVSSAGPDPARAFLLARASNTMMVDVPYARGPADLGALSLTAAPPAPPFYLWVFRNLCLEVKARDTAVDALAVARWLQALAARSLVRWGDLERAAALRVVPETAKTTVGRVVDLEVEAPADARGARYLLQVEVEPGHVQVVGQQDGQLQLKALQPGTTTVSLHWVDSQTLIARRTWATLEVAPLKP